MELMVPLYAQDKRPLYEQTYQYIKDEIRGGCLTAWSRLPSTRVLADNLKVSRSTTQMAGEQLCPRGILRRCPAEVILWGSEELVEVKGQETGEFCAGACGEPRAVPGGFLTPGHDLTAFLQYLAEDQQKSLVDDNKGVWGGSPGRAVPAGGYRQLSALGTGVTEAGAVIIGAGSEYLCCCIPDSGNESQDRHGNPTTSRLPGV